MDLKALIPKISWADHCLRSQATEESADPITALVLDLANGGCIAFPIIKRNTGADVIVNGFACDRNFRADRSRRSICRAASHTDNLFSY